MSDFSLNIIVLGLSMIYFYPGQQLFEMAGRSREVRIHSPRESSNVKRRCKRFVLTCAGLVLTAASFNVNAAVNCVVAVPTLTFAGVPLLNSPQDVVLGKALSGWIETPLTVTHNNCTT